MSYTQGNVMPPMAQTPLVDLLRIAIERTHEHCSRVRITGDGIGLPAAIPAVEPKNQTQQDNLLGLFSVLTAAQRQLSAELERFNGVL